MPDQQLVSDNSTIEINTSIHSQAKGFLTMSNSALDHFSSPNVTQEITMPTSLLDTLSSTSPIQETIMPDSTLDTLSSPNPTLETSMPTPTPPSNPRIQRLCSLYAHHLSDFGNARNFISQFGDQVRYVPTLGWLLYTDTHWQLDTTDQILSLAVASLQSYYETADALADTDTTLCTRLLKHAQRSHSSSRLKALLSLARSLPGITLLPDALDSHPNLLNVLNGTLDLTTLELLPHNPNQYLTRLIPIAYEPNAISPTWTSFLNLLTNHDHALHTYLQLAVGYSLTGHSFEHLTFLLHGPDQHSLQLFLSLISQLFGSYTHHLPLLKPRSLTTSSLIGARLLTTSTSSFLSSCHYPTLSSLLNADPITPRPSSSLTFKPQATLWLSTSTLPQLPLNLTSLSQHLKIIPLTSPLNHPNLQNFTTQLADALPAILTWAVEGALRWPIHGLVEPECVTSASRLFQEEQDTLASFLEACCIFDPSPSTPTYTIPARDLYQAYALYTRSQGQTPLSEHKFSPLILARNFTRTRHTAGRTYHGLALRLPLPELAAELQPTSVTIRKRSHTTSHHPNSTLPDLNSIFQNLDTLSRDSLNHPSPIPPSQNLLRQNLLM